MADRQVVTRFRLRIGDIYKYATAKVSGRVENGPSMLEQRAIEQDVRIQTCVGVRSPESRTCCRRCRLTTPSIARSDADVMSVTREQGSQRAANRSGAEDCESH